MIDRHHNGGVVIVCSFIAAYMLTAMPLPAWAAGWRPAWVMLVLIYWCLALPERVGIGIAWVSGLLLDVQQGAIFGQNAIVMVIVAYIIIKLHQRIRVYPLTQQALLVCLFVLLSQLLMLWIRGMAGIPPQHWSYWAPALTSMILWPWSFIILRDIRRKFHVF